MPQGPQAQGKDTRASKETGEPVAMREVVQQLLGSPAACPAGREESRSCRKQELYRAFLASCGVRYYHCGLENFRATTKQQKKVLKAVKDYAKRLQDNITDGKNLLLIGPAGTGKDHLLIALAKLAIWHFQIPVKRLTGPELFRLCREAMQYSEETHLLGIYKRCKVLLLSDPVPPAGQLTGHQASVLYEIVDFRYRNQLPIWCTLNASDSKEADKKLTPVILDRIVHGALVLRCNWPSFRKEQDVV